MKAILKYLAIFIFIILIVIVPLMLLDSNINKSKDDKFENSKRNELNKDKRIEFNEDTVNSEYKPYYAVKEGTELRDTILDIIYEYVYAINDGDYEKAYNLLSPGYREYKFQDLNKFIAYCRDRYKVDIGITVDNIKVIENSIITGNIEIFSDQVGDKPLAEEDIFMYKDIVTVTNIGEKMYLAFDNFYKDKLIDKEININTLAIKIQKQYIFGDKSIFTVTVKNLADEKLNIWDVISNIAVTDVNNKVVWIHNKEKTIDNDLIPLEEKTFKWSFNSIMTNGEYMDILYKENDVERNIHVQLNKI